MWTFQYRDIELEILGIETSEADGTGITVAPEDRLKNTHITNGTASSEGMFIDSSRFFDQKELNVFFCALQFYFNFYFTVGYLIKFSN